MTVLGLKLDDDFEHMMPLRLITFQLCTYVYLVHNGDSLLAAKALGVNHKKLRRVCNGFIQYKFNRHELKNMSQVLSVDESEIGAWYYVELEERYKKILQKMITGVRDLPNAYALEEIVKIHRELNSVVESEVKMNPSRIIEKAIKPLEGRRGEIRMGGKVIKTALKRLLCK